MSVPFPPHHILTRLSVPHCMFSPPLSNINWPQKHRFISGLSVLFHWSLCCFYACTMLFWLLWPCSIVWYQVVWFLQLCSFSRLLWLFRVFCGFHINFRNICSSFVKHTIGILIGIASDSIDILMMLILPLHEHSMCFHLFVPSSVSYSFLSTGLL